jgi:hypothetical protein
VSLAPLDHIVFSSVDVIIRGDLASADLDEAKHLFGVKFWGSVVVGKGGLFNMPHVLLMVRKSLDGLTNTTHSACQA